MPTDDERATLLGWARSRTLPARQALPARIVPAAAEGQENPGHRTAALPEQHPQRVNSQPRPSCQKNRAQAPSQIHSKPAITRPVPGLARHFGAAVPPQALAAACHVTR